MRTLPLKPNHKKVAAYHASLAEFAQLGVKHETAVRAVFQALLDSFRLMHGLWEAKDTADDLDKEITRKFKLGYPRDNILFQSPMRAVFVQDGERALDRSM